MTTENKTNPTVNLTHIFYKIDFKKKKTSDFIMVNVHSSIRTFCLNVSFTIICYKDYVVIYKGSDNWMEWQLEGMYHLEFPALEHWKEIEKANELIEDWNKKSPMPANITKRRTSVEIECVDEHH